MGTFLLIAVFTAWWIHTGRVARGSWRDTLLALVQQLAFVAVGVVLLPRWAWGSLLAAWVLRPFWIAVRRVARTQRIPAEPRMVPLEEADEVPQALVDAATRMVARATPLEVSNADAPPSTRGVDVPAVPVASTRSGRLVDVGAPWFRARGFFLFRYEKRFGVGRQPDRVAVAREYDPYGLMRVAGTNGANYGIDTDSIVAWLKALDREHPLMVTGFGSDYVEGNFTTPLSGDAVAEIARQVHDVCPDVVSQGVGSESALRSEIARSGSFFCWWD